MRKPKPSKASGDERPATIYARMTRVLEGEMGEGTLAQVLSDVRATGVRESLPLGAAADVSRLMGRLGWLEGLDGPAREKRTEEILREIAQAVDRTPAVLSVVFRLYADGLYGVLPQGICGNPPLCDRCGLTRICAYYNAPPRPSRRDKGLGPAERLRRDGAADLADEELLALVLGGGRRVSDSLGVAQELIGRYGSLRKLSQAAAAELESYAAVQRPMALRLLAAVGFAERMADEKRRLGPVVRSGKDFYDLYHRRLRDLRQEVFLVVLLDQRNRIIREAQVSQGSLTASLVHPREVFGPAVREAAAAVALVHNHPSGDPSPSPEDLAITRRLAETAQVVGVRFLDHVIVGESAYTSFVDEDLL